MTQTKSFVVAALFAASASAIKFRPPVGSVPWQIPVTVPEFENVDSHPVNYFVPNFGVDQDIIDSSDAIAVSEKALKKELHASFGDDAKLAPLNPRNYFVPDFGVDHDIKATTSSIAQSEDVLKHKMVADFKFDKSTVGTPRDYFVPDFGVDHEVMYTESNIANAEKKLNHTMMADFKFDKSNVATPRDYFVPDFGVDRDIKWTKGSLKQSEKALKHTWTPVQSAAGYWENMPAAAADSSYVYSNSSPEFSSATKTIGSTATTAGGAQNLADTTDLQLESDPICSSAGCTQYKAPEVVTHPMDYFVPNFGMDKHVMESEASEKWASKETGHKWDYKFTEKVDPVQYKIEPLDVDMKASLSNLKMEEGIHGKWEMPEDEAKVMIDMQSDPICSSAGCTQYKQTTEPGYPMDYFVPDFGVDHDVKDSFQGLKIAQDQLKHNWDFKFIEKPAWEAGMKVPDFGVDEEILNAQEGEKWASNELNHKWTPTQDKNGFWNVPEAASNDSYSYDGNSGFTNHLAGPVFAGTA